MNAFQHVMLDIETLGTRAGCVMFQVGAVAFNLNEDLLNAQQFICNIDIQSSIDNGFQIEARTMKWWATENGSLFATLLKQESLSVDAFIHAFNSWWAEVSGDEKPYLWANGTHFDVSILEAYLTCRGADVPWRYNRVRDYRTILHPWFDDYTFAPAPREFTAHDALEDAWRQTFKLKEALLCLSKHNKAWLTATT